MKVVVGLAVAALLAFVVIGLILPRDWKVEVTTPTHATAAQLLPRVRDFRQWSRWGAPIAEATYTYSDQQGLVGSWMAWKAPTSRAKFILTGMDERSVKFDEMVERDEVNARGEIVVADGTLVWRDSGTLPPVIGGYFRGMMERALAEHMRAGLQTLNAQAEREAVAGTGVVNETPVVDAGAVTQGMDAGVVRTVDAGSAVEVDSDAADAGNGS